MSSASGRPARGARAARSVRSVRWGSARSGGARARKSDHALAADLARRAGERLLDLRARLGAQVAPAAVLAAEGDRRSHRLLAAALAESRPDDAVLSEEADDDGSRLGSRRVWIIDPLDGTREFSEPPRDDWAVHVALAVDGRPAAGAVALPAMRRVLSTAQPQRLPVADGVRVRLAVSRSRPPQQAAAAAAALGAEIVPIGSAGAKAMSVVRGETSAYVHAGGQYEWDSCAPAAVAAAAGCVVSRIDGAELLYNRPDPWLPDLIVCRPELYPALRAALDGA